jgi:hypothetical protein
MRKTFRLPSKLKNEKAKAKVSFLISIAILKAVSELPPVELEENNNREAKTFHSPKNEKLFVLRLRSGELLESFTKINPFGSFFSQSCSSFYSTQGWSSEK